MSLSDIVERHPLIFRGKSPINSSLPVGWAKIVDDLCYQIERDLNESELAAFNVEQIKEKFGGLRFYATLGSGDGSFDQTDSFLRILVPIARAEDLSRKICMTCGSEGVLMDDNGYIHVACDEHKRSRARVVSFA